MAFRLAPIDVTEKGLFIEVAELYKGNHFPLIFLVNVVSTEWVIPASTFNFHEFNSHTISQNGIEVINVPKRNPLLAVFEQMLETPMKAIRCFKCSRRFDSLEKKNEFCRMECFDAHESTDLVEIKKLPTVMSLSEERLFPDGLPDDEIPDFQDFVFVGARKAQRCYHVETSGVREGRRCINPAEPGKKYCIEHVAGGSFALSKLYQAGMMDHEEARAAEQFIQQIVKDFPLVVNKPSFSYHLSILAKIHIAILKEPINLKSSAKFLNMTLAYNQLMEKLGISGEQSVKYKTKQNYEMMEKNVIVLKEILETVSGPCEVCGPIIQVELQKLAVKQNGT